MARGARWQSPRLSQQARVRCWPQRRSRPPQETSRSRRTSRRFFRRSARPATSRARSRRCRSSRTRKRVRGRGRSSSAWPTRQMPPWHIDRSVGVQKFKNDMSLSDEQVEHDRRLGGLRARRKATRPTAAAQAGRDEALLAGRARRLRPAGPRREVGRAARCRRSVRTSGGGRWSTSRITEPRWVRMVEIRPSNIQGRKILHHSDRVSGPQSRQRRRP